MAKKHKQGMDFSQTWEGVADFINQLPQDQRAQYRKTLGVFMHDMKHTLGLINNANELIRRDVQQCPEEHHAVEMIEIIKKGSQQLDGYLNTMLENCCHRIVEE
jgi:hypothetical protein